MNINFKKTYNNTLSYMKQIGGSASTPPTTPVTPVTPVTPTGNASNSGVSSGTLSGKSSANQPTSTGTPPANPKEPPRKVDNIDLGEALKQDKKKTASQKKMPPLKKLESTIMGMHEDGKLKSFIDNIISQFGVYITIGFMVMIMPIMPVIFYLSILYNVILLTWENFKALDTDNIK